MTDINPKIWNWFDNEKIDQAILGQGNYFIPSVTYRDQHDRLLIFRQLLEWANNEEKVEKATACFDLILNNLEKSNSLRTALDVVWSYLICENDMGKKLPVNLESVEAKLNRMIIRNGKTISQDSELRKIVMVMSKRMPGILGKENMGS